MKLVVSDVDGTLLKPGEDTVNEAVLSVICELTKCGILFAAASGRNYFDLCRIFDRVKQDMIFIPSDGAAVFYKGNRLCCYPIDQDLGFAFMKDVYQYTEAEVVLYGAEKTYILPKEKEFKDNMLQSGNDPIEIVTCRNRVKADYLKIACYHKSNVEKQLEEYLPYWKEKFHIPYRSKNWIEFTACGVHKAAAVEKLLDLFRISKEELLVFGDNENDKELLSLTEFAYAMKGAKAEIKRLCAYETEDVVKTIEALCFRKR